MADGFVDKAEMDRLVEHAEASMMDRFQYSIPGDLVDEEPRPETMTWSQEYICGLHEESSDLATTDAHHLPANSATLRFSLSVEVPPDSYVRITRRYGKAVSPPVVYRAQGAYRRGISAKQMSLMLVIQGAGAEDVGYY